MLGDQAHALQVLLEVALGQALPLGDHAESMGSGGFRRLRMFENLLGLHHRVQRRLGLGEARLRAEAAVLRAAARLGVDQRAHVGRVAEALHAGVPGALDERFDLRVILQLAQPGGLLASDQRRHGPEIMERCGRYLPSQRGARRSANARIPSRMSCEANEARRSSISSCSTSGEQLALGRQQRRDHALVAFLGKRRVARELAGQLERQRLELLADRDPVDEPPLQAPSARRRSGRAGTARACAPRRSRR